MFLYLIIGVIVLSSVLAFAGVSVTETIAVPDAVEVVPDYYEDSTQPIIEPGAGDLGDGYEDDWHLEEVTIPINGLLSVEGIRFIFTSFVPNFAGFGVVAVTFVALMGAGVAEASGLMGALIRLLVGASPRRLLAFILIFVGVLSSVASDAGYLILVPLGAAAFASVGRHPLAGMAACFAGVGAIFTVNPILGADRRDDHRDHERGARRRPAAPLTIVANWFFSIVSSIVLAIVAAIVTERIVEPRLGAYQTGSGRRPGRDLHRGRCGRPSHDPAAEKRGPALRAVRLPRVPRAHPAVHGPGGRAAARPGDRRHHRHHAVHGQPAVHHRDVLPRSRASAYGFGAGTFKSAE